MRWFWVHWLMGKSFKYLKTTFMIDDKNLIERHLLHRLRIR